MLASAVLRHTSAEDELRAGHAVAHGQALSMGAKDVKLTRHTRKLTALAFPTVPIE